MTVSYLLANVPGGGGGGGCSHINAVRVCATIKPPFSELSESTNILSLCAPFFLT